MINTNWLKLNYLYFILVALIGLMMRSTFLGLPLPYSHLLHTHSHTAFLGWVYPTFMILLINSFLDKESISKYKFNLQIIITHVLIFVMFISFLAQAYGLYSIVSSSLSQIVSYWFIFSFFKALKQQESTESARISNSFLKIALWALFASTFGPWAVGILKAAGLGGSDWYKMAIYYYMHFQYNGWILFALFALFFKLIEKQFSGNDIKFAQRFLIYMAYALVPGYFLSILDLSNSSLIYSLAALSAILQINSLYLLGRLLFNKRSKKLIQFVSPLIKTIAILFLFAFSLKTVLQFLSIIPSLTKLAFSNHAIVIAFIHLIMLGFVSTFLIAYLAQKEILSFQGVISKIGLTLFMAGFIATEIILGFQFSGWLLLYNVKILAGFTLCLALGVILMYPGFFKFKK
jgi:hypothetical protein